MAKNLPPNRGKVLIADDSSDLRFIYSAILQRDGWQTMEACNGKEALNKIIDDPPDVVILDERMPEMTGSELYLRMLELAVDCPVVLTSAALEVKMLAEKLGIKHCLGKPMSMEDLLSIVRIASSAKA